MGPPASAKTMSLTSSMHQLKNSFADGANTKKDGTIDIYLKMPRHLLIDQIDKMTPKSYSNC
jgi:hypothetical protein